MLVLIGGGELNMKFLYGACVVQLSFDKAYSTIEVETHFIHGLYLDKTAKMNLSQSKQYPHKKHSTAS